MEAELHAVVSAFRRTSGPAEAGHYQFGSRAFGPAEAGHYQFGFRAFGPAEAGHYQFGFRATSLALVRFRL